MSQVEGARRLLIANRGEIAIRVARAAGELGLETLAVHSEDDAGSPHLRAADRAVALEGAGPRAYLDAEQIVGLAALHGCALVHPGYGFLSESADLARRCEEAGIRFVGPKPGTLEELGDKARARDLADRCGVQILAGSPGPVSLDEARAFFAQLGDHAMALKAVNGGGGRGLRVVESEAELAEAYERCQSEARLAFGDDAVYAEQWLPNARHVEVQIIGDGSGRVSHVWERECSLQRRHQKLVEVAPAPGLSLPIRERLLADAVKMAKALAYQGLGTFEFLVDAGGSGPGDAWFIEANPRVQVEHTVTEAVTGLDLVQLQLRIAMGEDLEQLGCSQVEIPQPRGFAVQARVNMERPQRDGSVKPSSGTLALFEPPSGPGVRVDHFGAIGMTTSPRFDSLLAKVIAHATSGGIEAAIGKAERALREFRIEGVPTNLPFLVGLLQHPEVRAHRVTTGFIADEGGAIVASLERDEPSLEARPRAGLAGAQIDTSDPLAVLQHGKAGAAASAATAKEAPPVPGRAPADTPPGALAVRAPLQGTIVSLDVAAGDDVRSGQPLLVLEAMKMEHVIPSPVHGRVVGLPVAAGDTVFEDHPLVFVEAGDATGDAWTAEEQVDLGRVRPDLEEVQQRHAKGMDELRPEAVARRRKTGQRTARENLEDLVDPQSFIEYGALVIAAQRRRRSLEDLIDRTPADGMIAGIGQVNGSRFPEERARCAVLSYDYTVLAGTQGQQNHRKKDRLFELAEQHRLPVVFFTEGGGGRPGDTDGVGVAGLDCMAFHYFGRLSGLVPLVGINSGRCFAGNAALLGCCDVVIATENSNIGMGGPAMIEGGGLGIFRPEEVGPMEDQVANGVVDLPVADEAEAVAVAKQYLSYFQGPLEEWDCADQTRLRGLIPENRLRIYDVRRVIESMADTGSVLELRRAFGPGMITALMRVEGRPMGVIANDPTHLAGAIDSDGADKAARFMQLCDAFDLPILFLCDTPGIMVGPQVEKTALVRHAARMFVTGGSLSVPFFTIVLRKGYGLGAQAMAGGSFKAGLFTVAWPTGEFGGMGLEGAVKLGYRKELESEADPEKRRELYETMVERMYQHGKAVNTASHFEIDDVIDPADSRHWITTALRSAPAPPPRSSKKRPCIDTW